MTAVEPANLPAAGLTDEVIIRRLQPMKEGWTSGSIPNEGRIGSSSELLLELDAIAREFELRFKPGTPASLGRQMQNMEASLQQLFEVKRSHTSEVLLTENFSCVSDGHRPGCPRKMPTPKAGDHQEASWSFVLIPCSCGAF